MIGIILVTQGALGVALRETMEHVVGPQTQLETVSVGADDDLQQRRLELEARIREVDHGDGVMLVTDMFGSTPSNLAVAMMLPGRIEVLGGANLPMLVKLAQMRETHTLGECTALAEEAARKYINCASHLPQQCLDGARRCAEEAASKVHTLHPQPVTVSPPPVTVPRRAVS
ncbi:PTS sugar transporter subunit IIA [Acetobacter fallax]|uniref:PTS fructose transporter subunit IIA n=1 Tax=Acetobacter fallax TaxID=1737473 RepID=A0ABX0KB12_9PROT|nr:PTS sugar transporter subunit IIA [Acetobacter fallax]NHO32373.1 PTS fructose transporter subunit IIA [Acetobacter fallax]NHO35959.1 PTS fructose transporter subunit IIA [Acetobacter fallax]